MTPINNSGSAVYQDTEYDSLGRISKVSRPRYSNDGTYYKTEKQYDALNRVIKEITPDDNGTLVITTFSYNGLVTTSTNPKTQTTISRKNVLDQVVSVTDNLSQSINYTYDTNGNLLSTSHSSSPVLTTMTYDDCGRKTSMSDPDMGYWTYRYNGFGELVKQTSANGNTVMEYDLLGRMTKRTEAEGVSTWEYDSVPGITSGLSIGKLIRSTAPASQGGSRHTSLYDSLGRITQEKTTIDGEDFLAQTTYDEIGRPAGMRYPTGFSIYNVYNSQGYLTEIRRNTSSGETYWKAESWEADGSIKTERLGNGIVTVRTQYAPTGRLKNIQSGLNNGAGLQNLGHTYDVLGNLTSRTDYKTNQSEGFTYDGMNRLYDSQIQGGDLLQNRYDVRGNLTLKKITASGGTVKSNIVYDYSDAARPNRLVGIQNQTYGYDGCGNMMQLGGRTVSWTSWNMVSAINGQAGGAFAGVNSTFKYDAERNRVKQIGIDRNGLSTTTLYLGGYERINTGLTIEHRHHINSPAGPIAVYGWKTGKPEETNYLLKDHLGSIVLVTDSFAVPVVDSNYSYDAWGKRRNATTLDGSGASTDYYQKTTAKTTRGYTGHEELDDLGLVHMNGRIYNPELGRMISADPFVQAAYNTQSYNRYSYVMNNPLSETDPSGYFSWGQILGAVVAVVAGIVTAGIAWAAYAAAAGAYASFGAALGAAATGAAFSATGAAALGVVGGGAAFTGTIVAGAGFGFGSAFAGTLYAGGSLGQALKAGAIGAVVGAVSAGIAHGIGSFASTLGKSNALLGYGAKVGGHALLGGALTEAQGGDFGDGALAAGVSAGFSPLVDMIPGSNAGNILARTAVAAVVGGTAAELGGGKFENGATTAAFMHLFNDESHLLTKKKTLIVGLYGAGGRNSGDGQALANFVESNGGSMLNTRAIGEVVDYIRDSEYDRVVLVGYSRGGQSAVKVANALGAKGLTVNVLITFDPHDFGITQNLEYNNVEKAFNYYQRNAATGILGFPSGNNPYRGSPLSSSYITVNQFNLTGQRVGHNNIISYVLNRPKDFKMLTNSVNGN